MDFAIAFIGLAAAGVFVGVCSGLLGIGGGTVMIPLLRLVFGLDAYMATATSLFTIIPTSLSGAATHVRNRTCYPVLGVALGIGGACTSALGVLLASISPAWAIMLVAALIIFYSSYTMLVKAVKAPHGRGRRGRGGDAAGANTGARASAASGRGGGSAVEGDAFEVTRAKLLGGFAIGLFAGLASGYVGVGGGFVMVPLMTAWLGVPVKKASGTSVIAIIILAVPGVIEQCVLGHVDYLAGVLLAVGSIPGAYLGARLVSVVSERQLRFLFAGFLLVAGTFLILNELGVL